MMFAWMRKANHRIAVVDDDASVRKALMRLLETSSYDVKGFGSARDLLSGLAAGLPECLIVDLQMPNMTGLELQLRNHNSDYRNHGP